MQRDTRTRRGRSADTQQCTARSLVPRSSQGPARAPYVVLAPFAPSLCRLAPADPACATFSQHLCLLWPLSTGTLKGHLVNSRGHLPPGNRSLAPPLGDVLPHESRDSFHLSCLPSPAHAPPHLPQGPTCPAFCPHDSDPFRRFLHPHKRTTRLPPLPPARSGRRRKMFDKCPRPPSSRQQSLQHLLQNKHGGRLGFSRAERRWREVSVCCF